ncbi:hypothetical protein, partial [Rhodoferax sp.]|uniref:hypothetical protein n=1 Tax=Rhodoferax sp. TaxID=50421 RepID=UPI0035204639
MNIIVNEELKAYIDPLTTDEYEALERSIRSEGCRDALVLWNDLLIDGHNRYAICQAHGLPFQTLQSTQFKTIEDVHIWMIDQHLGRRSVSDFQRGVLALRKREIVLERRNRAQAATPPDANTTDGNVVSDNPPWNEDTSIGTRSADQALPSREDVAKAARLSSSQMMLIEKIQKQAAPEVVAAVKSGVISINAAAAVSSLPAEDQVAAAAAGKDELKQAAKRVRDAKRKPRDAATDSSEQVTANSMDAESTGVEINALRKRVVALEEENAALRKLTLPSKNVSLAECLNSRKENGNDENGKSAIHARIQARSSATGRGRSE